jgi:hypothetical protein
MNVALLLLLLAGFSATILDEDAFFASGGVIFF